MPRDLDLMALADGTLLVGNSPALRDTLKIATSVAQTDAPVLITGERGVGKDLVARLIHERSPRSRRQFVSLNVCAIADTLFESELFGQKRGAFTGAYADREGYLAEADGGTLFLDEIGALSMAVQGKLLRAVEQKTYRAIGGRVDRVSDFRIVAATNENLIDRIQDRTFRADLRDRLNVVSVHIPPLRDRAADISTLVHHFVGHFAPAWSVTDRVPAEMVAVFEDYDWPGNVRQLRSTIQQFVVRAMHLVTPWTVEAARMVVAQLKRESAQLAQTSESRHDFERRQLLQALERESWKIEAVAASLHVDRRTVYRKLQRAGIEIRSAARGGRDSPRDSL